MMQILTDVDGVLLNYEQGFRPWVLEKYGYKYRPEAATDYRMGPRYGISESQVLPLIQEFNETQAQFLKPWADAVPVVSEIAQEFDARFIAITSFGIEPKSVRLRQNLLINLFGDIFDDVICVPLGTSKKETLAKWANSKLYWIEDYPNNAVDGEKLGLTSLLVNHNYNILFPATLNKIKRVGNWKEIKDFIKAGK